MTTRVQRIAINCGGGYIPGINAVVAGAVRAASLRGWNVVGIRDGYDGLLLPERYPDRGLVKLDARAVELFGGGAGNILGTGATVDPFLARTLGADNQVTEVDRSEDLIKRIRAAEIDAVISIVGGSAITGMHAMTVAYKLHRKGLRTVCIPKSIENDVPGTALAFGYSSALAYATETLDRIRSAALDIHRIAVIEVPGENAGWLALQSGMAVCADAVLIPEVRYDLRTVASAIQAGMKAGARPSLVVVSSGAMPAKGGPGAETPEVEPHMSALRKSMSPLSDPRFGEGSRVIERSGAAAEAVALQLQRLTDIECFPMALGQLVRAGPLSAVDRQLGLGCGAAAVRGLSANMDGVMVALQPPDLRFLPIVEAINKVRTVPTDSEFLRIARDLGISLGS